MECALIQMKTKTLQKLAEALAGLDHGTFGYYSTCGKAIGDGGMRALPFAGRCTVCEAARELAAPPRALPGGASRGRTARVA